MGSHRVGHDWANNIFTFIPLQLHCFACEYQVVWVPFVEETILSSSNDLGILVGNQFTTNIYDYFWLLDPILLVSMCIFRHWFYYCGFVVSFWNQKVWILQLCSSFSWLIIIIVFEISFTTIWIWELAFPFLAKRILGHW